MYRYTFLLLLLALTACGSTEEPQSEPINTTQNPIIVQTSLGFAIHEMTLIVTPTEPFLIGEGDNAHWVTFTYPFLISKKEVTAEDYVKCVIAGGCTPFYETGPDCTYDVPGKESHPINCARWSDGQTFCSQLTAPYTPHEGRLPTAEEWELAVRIPDGRKYPWGDSTSGWSTKLNSAGADGHTLTAPVGSFPNGNSSLGLQDMAGNVWEWTQSPACLNDTDCTNCPYPFSGLCGPNACGECESDLEVRQFKGGGYTHPVSYSRAAFRYYNHKDYAPPFLGFRCILPLPPRD